MDGRRAKLLTVNILPFSKLKYKTHAPKCKPLLRCTESIKHDNIETFFKDVI